MNIPIELSSSYFSILKYIENYPCWTPPAFDQIMRYLLRKGFNHQSAMELITINCDLSALTWQERVHNKAYQHVTQRAPKGWNLTEQEYLFSQSLRRKPPIDEF